MNSWVKNPRERQLLTTKLHSRYRKEKHKQEVTEAKIEWENVDRVWKDACENGKSNGKIRLCWLDLRHISSRIYTFQTDYDRELEQLLLDGIGISTLEEIPKHCKNLKHLSLASNCIKDISTCNIHSLCKLSHLNLLRNHLTHLPPSIGELKNLTRLDIANNKLTELPNEFGNLSRLKRLNLESNELSELPISFGNLRCEVVNLNSNKFTVCPVCILSMPNLRQFSIMGNELGCLPSGMEKFKVLQIFRASKNRIMILPDSIVDIPSLRCLWLDYNKLSALPPNFHRLTRLKELKLEGNVDMVYPPLQKVAMGTEEILCWSRNRSEMSKTSKVRHIIQSLEEVLNQVKRYRIGGPLHESIFEVVDEQFQFPPDALWSIFLPELSRIWSNPKNSFNEGIKTFPFERREVEQALFEFRDAAGPIVKRISKARFRRCSCMQTGQSSEVCIPPKIGWMCTRPALLVRMKVAYEQNMREKRRLLAEEKRIADAAKAAETVAKSFLASEEGMIMVHEEAEKRMALLFKSEWPKKSRDNTLSISSPNKISETVLSGIHSTLKCSVSAVSSW